MNRHLYVFWTGENAIPENRQRSLDGMTNTGLEPVLVTARNLHDFIPVDRLHPAYPFLNLAHRADYLRCYFMKHHGGGYSDIKYNQASWLEAYEALERDPDAWVTGYREVSPQGVADLYLSSRQLREGLLDNIRAQIAWRKLQLNYKKLIGTCAFIFKDGTPLVDAWWEGLNQRLDVLLPRLEQHPAKHPKEVPGGVYDGEKSRYPVPWTHILGDIVHPLLLSHAGRVRYDLPTPNFRNYW